MYILNKGGKQMSVKKVVFKCGECSCYMCPISSQTTPSQKSGICKSINKGDTITITVKKAVKK